jgi:hypothetical protein
LNLPTRQNRNQINQTKQPQMGANLRPAKFILN